MLDHIVLLSLDALTCHCICHLDRTCVSFLGQGSAGSSAVFRISGIGCYATAQVMSLRDRWALN